MTLMSECRFCRSPASAPCPRPSAAPTCIVRVRVRVRVRVGIRDGVRVGARARVRVRVSVGITATFIVRAETAVPCVRPTQLGTTAAKARALELVESARSVRHTAPVARIVCPLEPRVRTWGQGLGVGG